MMTRSYGRHLVTNLFARFPRTRQYGDSGIAHRETFHQLATGEPIHLTCSCDLGADHVTPPAALTGSGSTTHAPTGRVPWKRKL
jgi:hypothetical protein